MNIETTENLADQLADWLGIYGCCKSTGDEGCEFDENKPFCCRMGFVEAIEKRMRSAVINEIKLNDVGLIDAPADMIIGNGSYSKEVIKR